MPRYRLTIEYAGTPFHGWQRQAGRPTVQGLLEEAVRRFSGEAVELVCAGRTDAGVHATAQVAHVDLRRDWDPFRVAEALNFHCKPHPVVILACSRAPEGFHARFSAIYRTYRYRIVNRRAPLGLEVNRAWLVRHPLDLAAMRRGARHLLGRHDFSSFRAANCQANSPMRTLDRLDIAQDGEAITLEVGARSFLYHQVRNMVGTLVPIGLGRLDPAAIPAILAARDRAAAGETAPPDGLYLTGVFYSAAAAAADTTGMTPSPRICRPDPRQGVGIDGQQGPTADDPGQGDE